MNSSVTYESICAQAARGEGDSALFAHGGRVRGRLARRRGTVLSFVMLSLAAVMDSRDTGPDHELFSVSAPDSNTDLMFACVAGAHRRTARPDVASLWHLSVHY